LKKYQTKKSAQERKKKKQNRKNPPNHTQSISTITFQLEENKNN